MAYVSSKPLSKKILKHIGDLLVAEIAKAKTTKQAQALTEALLTDTERVMLAKRFAAVVLLEEGASYRYIQNILKVSSSTVFRIQMLRKSGTLDTLIACTYKKERKQKNRNHSKESALEVLVRAGLPSMGKGRWKFLYKQTDNIIKNK